MTIHLPVASVVDTDAEKIVQAVREGKTVVADLATKTDTSWRKIPLLIAELKAPCKTDQFVQFAGHLDSWYYGAIDNGTGNAVQLEVARIAALHKNELKRNLRIVYYSGHSHGRYAGSAWYADHYWEDLYNNCAVNVNTDCPGCKGAEDIAHSIVMPEAKPLAIQIVRDQTGELFEGKRCGRLGDQSFWNVGVSSAFASFSRQKRKTIVAARSTTDTGPSTEGFERGNSELGPGWHTPMDLPMYIDQDNLLRDARIVGEYVLTCITSDVLPLRMEEESGEIVEKLQAWSDMANGTFDLSKSLKYARELHEKVKVFMDASIPAARKNDAIMKLGRLLIPVNFTRGNIYGTEPALPISAVPALEPIRKLVAKEMTEVNRMAVKVELVRAVNFINHSLKQAIDVTDAALEGINA